LLDSDQPVACLSVTSKTEISRATFTDAMNSMKAKPLATIANENSESRKWSALRPAFHNRIKIALCLDSHQSNKCLAPRLTPQADYVRRQREFELPARIIRPLCIERYAFQLAAGHHGRIANCGEWVEWECASPERREVLCPKRTGVGNTTGPRVLATT
jgi:hypothetical protein